MLVLRKINHVIGRETENRQLEIYTNNDEIVYFSTPRLAAEMAEDFNRNKLNGADNWKAYEIRIEPYRPIRS